jgi:hypothetical protein
MGLLKSGMSTAQQIGKREAAEVIDDLADQIRSHVGR